MHAVHVALQYGTLMKQSFDSAAALLATIYDTDQCSLLRFLARSREVSNKLTLRGGFDNTIARITHQCNTFRNPRTWWRKIQ
jgi:hypothetical protein